MSRAEHEAKRQAAIDMFTQGKHAGNSDYSRINYPCVIQIKRDTK